MIPRLLPLVLLALLGAAPARAALVEEQLQVPVKVVDRLGAELAQDIVVVRFCSGAVPHPSWALGLKCLRDDGILLSTRAKP
ncbi:MAG: hypothetical protein ACK5TK_16675 [Betaproteobacteria bacterium]